MRLVFTTDSIVRGGKERQMFILSRDLIEKGYNVKILARRFSEDNYLDEYGIDKKIVSIFGGKNWLSEYVKYRNLVFAINPEVILSYDLQTSVFSLLLKKKYKIVNSSIRHGIRLFRFSHILRSIICWLSPFVIANSHAGLRVNNLNVSDTRFVLYNGIENRFLNTRSRDHIEFERNQMIPNYVLNPGIVFIKVANLVPFKDYNTVLRALGKIKEHYPFYFIIVGDGPCLEEVRRLIDKLNLQAVVLLTGIIKNVSDYLAISDVLIHSSRGEGTSNSILEGMYSGLPVIATNVGGISETIFPDSSLLFPYKDEDALCKCLLEVPDIINNFNKESEKYKDHLKIFSVETMVKNFENILHRIVT